jgi:opacity protein-like surface antigen
MRLKSVLTLALLGLPAASVLAQEWETGISGGFGFARNLTVTSSQSGAGKAGFKSGAVFSAVAGNNMYERISGELRYTYHLSDLKVTGGGQAAGFKGEAHSMHYDLVLHATEIGARFRPFVAGGGGVKLYRGTGAETSYQPAYRFALLTKTQELQPLISVGGGVKIALSDTLSLRAEFRDYITPFPTEVVAPSPGAKLEGWLHDFVPMVGLSFNF